MGTVGSQALMCGSSFEAAISLLYFEDQGLLLHEDVCNGQPFTIASFLAINAPRAKVVFAFVTIG
jgi:hypothetical protein